MITKLKYVLLGIASLYTHSYLMYLITVVGPLEWWTFPTMAVVFGNFFASLYYVIHKIWGRK